MKQSRIPLLAVVGVVLPASLVIAELAVRLVFGSIFPRTQALSDRGAYAPDAVYELVSTKRRISDEFGAPELLDYLLPQDMPLTSGYRLPQDMPVTAEYMLSQNMPLPAGGGPHLSPDDIAHGDDVRPRVLIIGDSVAAGSRVAANETFTVSLAKRMPGYRFINIAQGGLNIYQIYAKFMIYYGKIAPAMVIYVACDNDLYPDVWLAHRRHPFDLSYLYTLDPRTGFPVLSSPVRWLLERDSLHSALLRLLIVYAEPALYSPPWKRGSRDSIYFFKKPFALFVGALEKICRLDGVPFLIVEVHPPDRYRKQEFLDILEASVPEKRNLHVFEMARDYFKDDLHLNARGHENLTRLLFPVLQNVRRKHRAAKGGH